MLISLIFIITILFFFITNQTILEKFKSNFFSKRKCFSNKLKPKERLSMINLIKVTNKILRKHNVDWIPIAGNLLSIYRYKKLILDWDDDFDFVVDTNKTYIALKTLENELPKYNCQIKFYKRWEQTGSNLYRIFYIKNKFCKNKLFKTGKYIWPYIDLFMDSENNNKNSEIHNKFIFRVSDMAKDLDSSEYPLKNIICEGIKIKIPSKGFRSYDSFYKNGSITTCYDDPYYHKYELKHNCKGINIQPCNKIKNIYTKKQIMNE